MHNNTKQSLCQSIVTKGSCFTRVEKYDFYWNGAYKRKGESKALKGTKSWNILVLDVQFYYNRSELAYMTGSWKVIFCISEACLYAEFYFYKCDV